MEKIRAYIIDSHVLVRQTLVNTIRNSEGISFFGSSIGITLQEIVNDIHEKNPDLIFLGIDDFKSDEMRLFYHLRSVDPTLPIIVITPLNEGGANIAITCLKYGAVDFITKPVRNGRLVLAKDHFMKRVTPVLQMAGRLNVKRQMGYHLFDNSLSGKRIRDYSPTFERLPNPVNLIVIGGCTGGVRSLFALISSLPKNLTVPVIVLQHMPKVYSKVLAEELNAITTHQVTEAEEGMKLIPGQIHLIPGGYHAIVKNDASQKTISLHRGPKEENSRPSLNVLLRSASYIYREKLLNVMLSGGGNDGVLGAREVADKGGQVIVESEESAMLWDLPKRLDDQGISSGRFPVEFLGKEISNRINTIPKSNALKRTKTPANFAVSG
ncbi:MAG: chemotaxis protein CheB [Balneolaceae bacterium]